MYVRLIESKAEVGEPDFSTLGHTKVLPSEKFSSKRADV